MKALCKLVGIALGFLSLLAGCGYLNETHFHADYGVAVPPPPPPIPHDPTVTLDDFSYTPPSPVSPGDTLEFTATTNKPTNAGEIYISFGDPPVFRAYLNDNGAGADDVANDGIWHGEFPLQHNTPPFEDLSVIARLHWDDGAEPLELAGEDLTILEDGE